MTDESKALVPIEEKQVEFYGDELTAVLLEEEEERAVYVPVRPIVENLGLTWSPQLRRINRDPVLSEVSTSVTVTVTETGQRGAVICLPLKFLPGFLFGISVNRVREELREKVIRYQRECYDVLWEAFQEGRLTSDPSFAELAESDSPAAVAYRMATAVMQLARQQLLLETRQEQMESRVDDHDRRLEAVEATLADPDRIITPAQATRISQAVKAIAMKIGETTGRNEYGGVYGELYRRFEIPGYRELPAARFDEAMDWLTEWWQEVAGTDEIPF
ncbi:MAG: phage antirepressor N-terminal domain-containing protein [Chloroflexota bacterium]